MGIIRTLLGGCVGWTLSSLFVTHDDTWKYSMFVFMVVALIYFFILNIKIDNK